MFDPSSFRPDDIVDAFAAEGEQAEAAQAAQLVVLAASLAFGAERLPEGRLAEVPGFARETLFIDPLPPIYLTTLDQVFSLVRQGFDEWFRGGGIRYLSGVTGSQILALVFAHSHGGNVAFDYLQAGGAIELLVLLHTPVIARRRASWSTIADRVEKVLVLSTKLDWVVWLDRAASLALLRAPLLGSLESVLGEKAVTMSAQVTEAWLSHSYYTEAKTWKDKNIAQNVARYHGQVHPR